MIRIGRYKIGLAATSTIAVFLTLSAYAVWAACHQARPEWPMPLADLIIINESMALAATIAYGIILHLAQAAISHHKKRKNKA